MSYLKLCVNEPRAPSGGWLATATTRAIEHVAYNTTPPNIGMSPAFIMRTRGPYRISGNRLVPPLANRDMTPLTAPATPPGIIASA